MVGRMPVSILQLFVASSSPGRLWNFAGLRDTPEIRGLRERNSVGACHTDRDLISPTIQRNAEATTGDHYRGLGGLLSFWLVVLFRANNMELASVKKGQPSRRKGDMQTLFHKFPHDYGIT
jgi:hypothetical protein